MRCMDSSPTPDHCRLPTSCPGSRVLIWAPAYMLLILLPLVFPDGRLPSRRWRRIVWIAGAALALIVVPAAIAYWPYRGPRPRPVGRATPGGRPGPRNRRSAPRGRADRGPGRRRGQRRRDHHPVPPLRRGGTSADQVVRERRLRRVRRDLRHDSPWVVLPPPFDALAAIVVAPLIPIAIGIAILRYRLYDIDRIISRTVVVRRRDRRSSRSCSSATILVSQTVLALVHSGASSVAVAASTLVVAALFQPLRRRVQARGGSPVQPRRATTPSGLVAAFAGAAARRGRAGAIRAARCGDLLATGPGRSPRAGSLSGCETADLSDDRPPPTTAACAGGEPGSSGPCSASTSPW